MTCRDDRMHPSEIAAKRPILTTRVHEHVEVEQVESLRRRASEEESEYATDESACAEFNRQLRSGD